MTLLLHALSTSVFPKLTLLNATNFCFPPAILLLQPYSHKSVTSDTSDESPYEELSKNVPEGKVESELVKEEVKLARFS